MGKNIQDFWASDLCDEIFSGNDFIIINIYTMQKFLSILTQN